MKRFMQRDWLKCWSKKTFVVDIYVQQEKGSAVIGEICLVLPQLLVHEANLSQVVYALYVRNSLTALETVLVISLEQKKQFREPKKPLRRKDICNMKPRYRYHRDDQRRPVVTECELLDKDGEIQGWGMAICSPRDQPCKKQGRAIALTRASQLTIGLPIRRPRVLDVLFSTTTSPRSYFYKMDVPTNAL